MASDLVTWILQLQELLTLSRGGEGWSLKWRVRLWDCLCCLLEHEYITVNDLHYLDCCPILRIWQFWVLGKTPPPPRFRIAGRGLTSVQPTQPFTVSRTPTKRPPPPPPLSCPLETLSPSLQVPWRWVGVVSAFLLWMAFCFSALVLLGVPYYCACLPGSYAPPPS